jgi:biopolymer transport protein ExbD
MGASVGKEGDYSSDMNVIPLVDILLVLLILFIITIPPMTQSVLMDLPQRTKNDPPPNEVTKVMLKIEFDGSMTWDGTPVNREMLKSFIAGASVMEPQPQVQIIVDPNANYENANMALFLLKRGSIEKVGFVNVAR